MPLFLTEGNVFVHRAQCLYPAILGFHCFVEDLIKPQSPPKNYRAQLFVVDYCKQSLCYALLALLLHPSQHIIKWRQHEWNGTYFILMLLFYLIFSDRSYIYMVMYICFYIITDLIFNILLVPCKSFVILTSYWQKRVSCMRQGMLTLSTKW